jgi:3-oxoacyl-[acyl-carrier protein] reductase
MTEADWDRVLDVNLKGSFLCAQAAARRMVAAGRGGAIVNLSSVAMRGRRSASTTGEQGRGHKPHPRVALRWRRTASASMRSPRAHRHRAALRQLGSGVVEMGRQIPLEGRMARPGEIARVAVFLAAEESGWVTGQTIHVNGGAFMGG